MGGLGGDNMTVILVCFLHNKPYEELIEKCKAAIANASSGSRKSSEADTAADEIWNGSIPHLYQSTQHTIRTFKLDNLDDLL